MSIPSKPIWQLRMVVGTDGEPAVRFLGPHNWTLVELPVSVVREAGVLLLMEGAALEPSSPESPRSGAT